VTSIELQNLLKRVQIMHAETQTLELKAAVNGCPTRLYDTLSSFSNQDEGGILLFGVDEKRDFAELGVYDAQDLMKHVVEQCNQMSPVVRPVFRRKYQDDVRPVERASVQTLDTSLLERYLLKLKEDRPNLAKLDSTQIYELMSITKDGVPTLSAVMLFSQYPQAYFPQLCITAVSVPGLEIGQLGVEGERFLDNQRIDGTLTQMLEGALAFMRKNMRTKTIIDPETGKRSDRSDYPIAAIREAVLNALVHRDYSIHYRGYAHSIAFV